jgi:hypothetical protein
LLLFSVALAAFAQPPADKAGTLEGEVRNSVTGAPIERAHVGARINNGEQRYGTYTDAAGKFSLTGLPGGSYVINADRVGFVGAQNTFDASVNVQPGDKNASLKLQLTPTGAIVGHVFGADGQPMEGMLVGIEIGDQTVRVAVTDDRGMYRIGGLRPGKLRVRAKPAMAIPLPPEIRTDGTAEVHYSPTYYPSALDARSAMRVEIAPAAEVTGVDIHMVRTPIIHVSGKVTGVPQGGSGNAPYIMVQPQGPAARVQADGRFEMWRVDPGTYTVMARVNSERRQYSSGPIPLEIGDQDVENLQIVLVEIGDVKGQVMYEDEEAGKPPAPASGSPQRRTPAPPARQVMLWGAGLDQSNFSGEIKEDGSFTVSQVPPGKYRVKITAPSIYVKSMSLGSANIDGSLLDFPGGKDAPLLVRAASAHGTLNGVVKDDKGPVAGAHVVIAEESLPREVAQVSDTKKDGTYTVSGLAPGKYLLFVVDDVDRTELRVNLEQFDDIAEKIEINDRETVTKDLKRK